MHRSVLLFASSALLATAFAQQPSAVNARPRIRHLPFGLQGNVHTVMSKTEKLRSDPRPVPQSIGSGSQLRLPRLNGRANPPTWISFNEQGRVVEQGNVSLDGKFASLTQNEGNTSTTTVQLPGKAPEIIEHRTTSSSGKSTTETYRDGQLTQKIQSSSAGNGHHFEHQTYDTEGKLLSEGSTDSEIGVKDHTYTTTFHTANVGPNGVLQDRKIVDRRSADHQSTEHSEYDANGNVLCTMRVSGTALVYSEIRPEANAPCYATAYSKEESKQYLFALYPNGGSGELFTDISTFTDLNRLFEPDTVERLDASANVIDKVSFRYERDAQGNWISRVVSVLDPATKDMVEIERDTRSITYYDQQ